MTAAGLLTLLLYAVILTAVASWSAGFVLWPLLRRPSTGDFKARSSDFWFLLGVAPLLSGLAVGAASLASAFLKGLGWIPDHCQLHPGHPHLCWVHVGTPWSEGIFFWASLATVAGLFLYAGSRVGRSLLALNRRLRQAEGAPGRDGFLIVPSPLPTAFVAGVLKPRAYLSTRACQLLTPRERRIVALHEREHCRRRDPLKLALLRMAAFLFPGFERIEREWKAAVEIECDWACLEKGATAKEVSMTILKLARSSAFPVRAPTLAYAVGAESALRRRIESLLSGVPPRRPGIGWGALAFLALILAAAGLSGVHHFLETILGTFAG